MPICDSFNIVERLLANSVRIKELADPQYAASSWMRAALSDAWLA